MTQWEYKSVLASDVNDSAMPMMDEILNDLGKDGWELVQLMSFPMQTIAVFKRPLSDYLSTEG